MRYIVIIVGIFGWGSIDWIFNHLSDIFKWTVFGILIIVSLFVLWFILGAIITLVDYIKQKKHPELLYHPIAPKPLHETVVSLQSNSKNNIELTHLLDENNIIGE